LSNLSDLIGGANLFGGENYTFVPDRFCAPNSALYFDYGYLQVPTGVYFSGDFTFTAWIYLKTYESFSRIFEFANNGNYSDSVFLAMNSPASVLKGFIYNGTTGLGLGLFSKPIINLNEWYFVSFVLNGTIGYIYVNGNQTQSGRLLAPNNINRTQNFIGKNGLNKANAIYDEIKIYQIALTSSQIMNEYIATSQMTSYFDKISKNTNNEDKTFYVKCLASQLLNNVNNVLKPFNLI
jgi:hypothetical protein